MRLLARDDGSGTLRLVFIDHGLADEGCEGECCGEFDCEAEKEADPFNIGGCCFADGSCIPLHRCDCLQAGGFFKGRFVTCAMFPPCAQPPAGGPGPGGSAPADPAVCVHLYEGQIQCIPDGSGGFREEIGPIARTRSTCEPCSFTAQYPANGPGGDSPAPGSPAPGGNNGWVRETRSDGSDWWVYKYCTDLSCTVSGDCTGGGPDPSEFGAVPGVFDLPLPPALAPGTISDYCANQTWIGPGDPPPYQPSIPLPPEPEGAALLIMAPSSMMLFRGATGGGCGGCKDQAEGGLDL